MLIETIQDLLLNEDKRNKVKNDSYEELLKSPDIKSYVMKIMCKLT